MPKEFSMPPDAAESASGITMRWTPSAQRLDVFGWYDSFVGIEGYQMSLIQFFERLGITPKDCAKAFESTPARAAVVGINNDRERR
jgi:hypothetical protein